MKQFLTLLIFFSLAISISQAQNILINAATNGTTVTNCGGELYDSGGANGNYGDNQNYTLTICSANPSLTTKFVTLAFDADFQLLAGDQLCFFDGPNTSAPSLGCLGPGNLAFYATALNTTGCITMRFTSNSSGNGTGFHAFIGCAKGCQTVIAALDSTNPIVSPRDTGWIDVCLGSNIFLKGKGTYPQSGLPGAYTQNDSLTSFEWNFGEIGSRIERGPVVNHTFQNAGGYIVQLSLTDTAKCQNSNFISQRVRVAPRPKFNVGNVPTQICVGQEVRLNAITTSINSTYNVGVRPDTGFFPISNSRSDSIELPDGNGQSYITNLRFNSFAPGARLTTLSDLNYIFVNMEHSWVGDIQVVLTCPNGQSTILRQFLGTGAGFSSYNLGVANQNDGDHIPGFGYEYRWTPTATQTWRQYLTANNPPAGSILPPSVRPTMPAITTRPSIPPTVWAPWTGPLVNYAAEDPAGLNGLLGCPLNGTWQITVRDFWGADDGYIFSWGISFNNRLYPNRETFTVPITQHGWTDNPFITQNNQDSILARPRNAGTASFFYQVTDTFGCKNDTFVNIRILPFTNPTCYTCNTNFNKLRDTTICPSDSIVLDNRGINLNQPVTFEAFPYKKINRRDYGLTPLYSTNDISNIKPTTITNPSTQIDSVCVDVTTFFPGYLDMRLIAPNGSEVLLFNNPSASVGQTIRGTCFTPNPTVTRTLSGTTAPYGGQTYQAQNGSAAWNALIGSPISGTWKLSAKVPNGTAEHTFTRWSLTLKYKNDATYTWTPNTNLSCNTCGNPTARPRATTTYYVTSVDSFNCTHRDTVTVTVRDSLNAPVNVLVNDIQIGSMRFGWNAVAGATGYEVRVNRTGAWIPANTPPLQHRVNGILPNTTTTLEVRATGVGICGARIASASRTYTCLATIGGGLQIDSIVCYGQASPFVNFSNAVGVSPLQYTIDTTVQDRNPIFRTIKVGSHIAYLQDGEGCRDSFRFTIGQPDSMRMTLRADSVRCKGTATGSVVATTVGLSGTRRAVTPYTYQWNSSATTTNTASNLFAGIVRVTVSDGSGCQKTDTVRVSEPDSLLIALRRDSARCYGASTGSVGVTARGGSPSYTYLWNYNATTTDSIANAPARTYIVTVTDNKNCTRTDSIRVLQADSLTLNFSKQDVACANGATGTARALVTGGTTPYTYAWSNNDTGALADSLRSGTFRVTVTDRNGCTKTAAVVITENSAIASTISSVAARCYGAASGRGSVRASGGVSPYTFAWDSRIFDSVATNLAAGLHFVTISDALGCRRIDSVQVTQPDSIRFDSLSSTPALCNSSPTGTARVVAVGGTSPYAYAWSPLNQATQTARNLIPGLYNIRVTDANGCLKNDTVRVLATAPLLIDSIRFVSNNCFGDNSASASVYPSGGAGSFTYRWSDLTFQTTQTATNLRAGNYAITVTDVNACQIVGNVNVTQPSQLVASQFNFKPVSCKNGEDGEARPVVIGGTPFSSGRYGYTYLWNDLRGQTDSVATGLKAGTYIVTVTDGKGCVDTAVIVVTEPASGVEADASQTALGCFGTSTSRAVVAARGGAGSYTYQWSNTQNTTEATGLSRQTYYVTVTDIRGCKAIDTIAVNTYDSIAVKLTPTQPLCFGYANGTVLIDSVRGGSGSSNLNSYNYVWNTSPRQIGTRAIGLLGSRTYVVTVTDQNGCFNIANTYLDQPGQILLGTLTSPVSCFGGSDGVAQVTAQGTNNNFTYLWEQAARSQTTARAADLAAGRYRVTITDSANCRLDTVVTITEPARLRMADKVITPNKCVGDSLGKIDIRITGGTPGYKYFWSSFDTLAQTRNLRAGTYYLSVTDIKGCLLFDTVTLKQPSPILAQVTASPVNCFGARDGRIDLRVAGGLPPYQFSTDNRSYNGISSIVGLKADDYDLYIRDANSCLWFNRVSVTTPPKLTVNAGDNVNIDLGGSTQLIATPTNARGTVTYLWRAPYDSTLSCTKCPNPTAFPMFTITYNVLVRDSAGCTADDNVIVTVYKHRTVVVPSAFTPNSDNVNDILRVRGQKGTKIKSYRIYDRWGELMYEARDFTINDINYGWDGTFRGQLAPAGMYVWYVEADYVDGEQESFKGGTMLLR